MPGRFRPALRERLAGQARQPVTAISTVNAATRDGRHDNKAPLTDRLFPIGCQAAPRSRVG